MQGWLSRIDKDAKDARDKRIFSKWLACWTQDEIAESEGIGKGEISGICSEFPELEKLNKSHQTLATYTYRLLESAEIRRNIFSPIGENILQPIPVSQLRPLAALPDPDPIFA